MQHTLVAVFDNRTDAQNALNELLSSGFTRTDVRLSNAEGDAVVGQSDTLAGSTDLDTTRSADGDTGITASIKNFFGDLFGSDNAEHADRYEGAVIRGHHVLTLVANSLPEVERGADIVERYGPTDIDETSSGTPGMASTGFSAGAMHAGSTVGMQQTSSMSSQAGSIGGASVQGAAIPSLDNAGDRNLFQQQSLNTAEPMGTTYQEPLGQSGLGATGGTSLQGSTLQGNNLQGSSLEGSIRQGSTAVDRGDSLQRDTSIGGVGAGSISGGSSLDKQRNGVRIFSRGQADAALGAATGFESGSGSSAAGAYGDDTYFRNHFDTTYGATGASYDEYQPAYSYGSEAARSGRYTNGAWDDIEADLRNDWDSRHATGGEPSTWEKMKAAVRHGWERMTRDDDDSQYRGHYDSTYASTGEKYDDLKPAYSYGTEMRRSEMYRNRPWDDVETDLRTGWDNRIDGTRDFSTTGSDSSEPSAWDRVKNAVRHGWDKMADDNDDDVYYRNHWNSVYGSTGSAYDEYQPAYSYGTEMARNDKYRGRPWTEVETDLRSDWDNRYPGEQSTWDKMKSAVRHGWERMMR
jgi:hypothetical protein